MLKHSLQFFYHLVKIPPDSVPFLPLGKNTFCIIPRDYNALAYDVT